MSSEMRELMQSVLDFVNRQPCRCMSIAQLGERDYCDRCQSVKNRRALLARTEAGADGADLIQWRYTNVETGEVLTPWTECDAAFREKRKDAPGYQFRELFTHPQDADWLIDKLRLAVDRYTLAYEIMAWDDENYAKTNPAEPPGGEG